MVAAIERLEQMRGAALDLVMDREALARKLSPPVSAGCQQASEIIAVTSVCSRSSRLLRYMRGVASTLVASITYGDELALRVLRQRKAEPGADAPDGGGVFLERQAVDGQAAQQDEAAPGADVLVGAPEAFAERAEREIGARQRVDRGEAPRSASAPRPRRAVPRGLPRSAPAKNPRGWRRSRAATPSGSPGCHRILTVDVRMPLRPAGGCRPGSWPCRRSPARSPVPPQGDAAPPCAGGTGRRSERPGRRS